MNGKNYKGKGKSFDKKGKKGSKTYEKDFDKNSKIEKETGFNDPSWYDYNPHLLKDASSFPFPTVLGIPINLNSDATVPTNICGRHLRGDLSSYDLLAPGLMAIDWVPSYGVSDSITSPLNITAQNIYSFVRKNNSGYANYESADLMSLFIAMDSIYILIEHLKRIYGMTRLYNITNRYVPKTWMSALGVDVLDVAANAANFRARLNAYIARAASISIPAGFKIFARHQMMAQAVYTDVESFNKSQTYMFVPTGYYLRNDITGELVLKPVNEYGNLESIFDALDKALNSVLLSEDVAVMCGDIRKAYENNLEGLSYLQEDYVVPVIYDAGLRSQIENMRAYPISSTNLFETSQFNITPQRTDDYNGWLKYEPSFILDRQTGVLGDTTPAAVPLMMSNGIINMHWKDVQPMDTMYATRLISTISHVFDNGDTSITLKFGSVGSEILTRIRIYSTVDNFEEVTQYVVLKTNASYQEGIDEYYWNDHIIKQAQAMSCFDWHPIQYLCKYAEDPLTTESEWKFEGVLCDLDNFTEIPAENIKLMSEIAMFSLFNIPAFGTFN